MIQEISPHQYDNTYRDKPPHKDSYVLYYKDRKILLRDTPGQIDFPRFHELQHMDNDIYEEYIFLFIIDGVGYYLIRNLEVESLSPFYLENIESLREANPQYQAFAGITGYQLSRWYRLNTYCGLCGAKTSLHEKERALLCKECEQIIYPKLSPAVIIGVTRGEEILLTKYANRNVSSYALVAGYVEIGESLEECVRREVMEEVGLPVKNITYYKSQPWSFTDTILMGFYCEVADDSPIVLDEEELSVATWYHRDDVPVATRRDSLTNEMIIYFVDPQLPHKS